MLRPTALNGFGGGRRADAGGGFNGFEIGEPVEREQHPGVRLFQRARWTDGMVSVYGPGARTAGFRIF